MQPDLAPNVRPGVRFLLEHPAHLIALGFGSGLSPVAPGTVGTLWGWLAFVVAQRWLSLPQLAFVTLAALPAVATVPALIAGMALCHTLDAFAFGDVSAMSLGVPVNAVRWMIMVGTALLTALSVAFVGPIGFDAHGGRFNRRLTRRDSLSDLLGGRLGNACVEPMAEPGPEVKVNRAAACAPMPCGAKGVSCGDHGVIQSVRQHDRRAGHHGSGAHQPS